MVAPYYARSPNAAGEYETVCHHLTLVSALCSEFLSPVGARDAGVILGALHDLGKYSELFAAVLRHQREHVNHAAPGAAVALARYGDRDVGRLLALVISAHHSQLDGAILQELRRLSEGRGDPWDENRNEFSLFGPEALRDAFALLRQEVPLPPVRPALPPWQGGQNDDLSYMLCARFLFSALVDADYSASASHFEPDYLDAHTGPSLDPGDALERLFALREEKRRVSRAATPLNALRDQLFEDCLHAAALPPGLFTLTAPTGLGKTLSLFAFAVKHAQHYHKRRIILILPFLALAEQNTQDYRYAVPELLESHSAAVLDEQASVLAERWSSPCIVTTTVGFFEPLFSSRPTDCRRLHQIADSVIVLDEAQSLPPHLLNATLQTVDELCRCYGCTVVFSTATQPSFQYRPGLSWTPREIVPQPQALFNATRRYSIEWRLDSSTSMETIADELSSLSSCCAIVNLRRHARMLYQLLGQRCDRQENFFLSTDLCPAHRGAILVEIRRRQAAGLPCRLVSTQCIEAGVDLDFSTVYRALAPLESIIQAAGRCNRNGDSLDGHVVVFIPDLPARLYPSDYYQVAANCVLTLLSRHPIDCSNLGHIEEYYALLYPYGGGDSPALQGALHSRDFPAAEDAYHLIDRGSINVVVPYPPELEALHRLLEQYRETGLTHSMMKRLRPFTVSVYSSPELLDACEPLYVLPASRRHTQSFTGWYLLGISSYYTPDVGLHIDPSAFDGILS